MWRKARFSDIGSENGMTRREKGSEKQRKGGKRKEEMKEKVRGCTYTNLLLSHGIIIVSVSQRLNDDFSCM